MSLAERELILRLVRTMQRADPVWCELHGLVPVTDEEWDAVLGEAEDYVEGAYASDKGEQT